ncbi:MAG: LysR family transcriptional regulator [Anaerostipes sp.]|jgi:DNA-binding transcriptional LysR family regulator|nr:LysR family transcriptional regulator [Anaerostipes sp.]MDD3746330.1 LysR family transcriptional regulator [Anaerostipes sp.]
MKLRVLRYFLEVAREENITRAASFLHVSQPTMSRQLKELEEELGKKLFIRSNYSVKLTEEGMLLRKRAEDILDMVDKTTAEFKALDEINGGDIRIGCAESEGITHFLRVIKNLQNDYPNIRYHFYSSGSDAIDERLDKGLLDFAIIVQEVDPVKYNYIKMPFSDSWGLLMRRDSLLADKEFISQEDLLNIPLICSRQSLNEEIPKWLGEMQNKLMIVATYDLILNTTFMVREGLGYALGFDKLINTDADSDLCFRPLQPPLLSPMYLIWKKYQVFTPAASLLLQNIKNTLAT